jgi:hypothetical protein
MVGRAIVLVGTVVAIAMPAIAQSNNQGDIPTQKQECNLNLSQKELLVEADRLTQQVIQLYRQGQYNTATPLANCNLLIQVKVLGAEHPEVAVSLNNLALLYQNQGN